MLFCFIILIHNFFKEKYFFINMARNYKGLEIWQLAYRLTLRLYKLTENFPEYEQNNLTLQIRYHPL